MDGRISSLGLAVLAALSFFNPIHAQGADPEHRDLILRGNSQIRTGSTLMWSGAALLPVSALALVPVLYDGAFGITAADPGIAIAIAVAGGALIHAGIPIYGSGASKLEKAAGGGGAGGPGLTESGWSHYRRSWKFLAGGSALLVAAYPFVVLAALDWGNENRLDYTALALGIGGISLLTIGALEQHFSLYRFGKAVRQSRDRLGAGPDISLQPLVLLDRQGRGPGAGMRLKCSF